MTIFANFILSLRDTYVFFFLVNITSIPLASTKSAGMDCLDNLKEKVLSIIFDSLLAQDYIINLP